MSLASSSRREGGFGDSGNIKVSLLHGKCFSWQERFRKTDRALEEVPTWPNVGQLWTNTEMIHDLNVFRLMPQRRSNKDCLFWGRVQSRTQRWPSNQSLSSKSSTKSSGLCRFLAPKSLFCQGKSTRRPIWRDHPDPWLVRIHQRRYS